MNMRKMVGSNKSFAVKINYGDLEDFLSLCAQIGLVWADGSDMFHIYETLESRSYYRENRLIIVHRKENRGRLYYSYMPYGASRYSMPGSRQDDCTTVLFQDFDEYTPLAGREAPDPSLIDNMLRAFC